MSTEGETQQKKQPASTFGRSVVDYVTSEELTKALQTITPQGESKNDWILPIPDPDCEEQTEQQELQRLLTLKSYMVLDADKEEEFDKLTEEAREVFGVPTSLISLIDLGRQFLFSNTGADVRETTRSVAFCSYTILNKDNILVVPDTTEDFRFKDGELVKGGPKLRFYAGAPLISPEGYKLGTFCVEGPEARPEGLTQIQKDKLKEYAAKTMELMVERRKRLRDRLSSDNVSKELRKHAGVATCLGDILYAEGDLVTAMRLYQESVQTIMYVEEDGQGANPPKERQEAMVQFLTLLSVANIPADAKKELLEKVSALYGKTPGVLNAKNTVLDGSITGFFRVAPKIKGTTSAQPLPGLVFNEVFKIDMRDCLELQETETRPIDQVPFTVPLEECSKATLFNMGQIHYHWGNQETAMQFFHLAASVSQKISPLAFDPVDISCINNMAQIHLQYGQADDAIKMLTETLERGNRALAAMYRHGETDVAVNDEEDGGQVDLSTEEELEQQSCFRTRRLRRKLARTLINIAHVHFYTCNYDAALPLLRDAARLIDKRTMTGRTLAAVHYDMALIFHHQGKLDEASSYLDKSLGAVLKLLGPDHLQNAEVLYRKALVLFEQNKFKEALVAIEECLRIRTKQLSESDSLVAETLSLAGRILLGQGSNDAALKNLKKCLDVQRKQLNGGDLTFDVAQTILEIGRAYHVKGDLTKSLEQYHEVLEWTRKLFGPDHAFVSRIDGIITTINSESGESKD